MTSTACVDAVRAEEIPVAGIHGLAIGTTEGVKKIVLPTWVIFRYKVPPRISPAPARVDFAD
jgi:hypothetical protein